LLEQPPKLRLWREAHGSIPVQVGPIDTALAKVSDLLREVTGAVVQPQLTA